MNSRMTFIYLRGFREGFHKRKHIEARSRLWEHGEDLILFPFSLLQRFSSVCHGGREMPKK